MNPVSIATAPNVSVQVSSIPMLIETDFQSWKASVEIVIGCMDLDLALRTERPTSTDLNEAEIEKWDRSNRMCLMVMKRSIPEAFWGLVEKDSARKFLEEIEPYFAKNDNPKATKLFADLVSMTYKGDKSIEKYIKKISSLALKLKSLKLELSEDLLVNLILISLPPRFGQFKMSYNAQKYKWSMDELVSRCVQEEQRQLLDITESADSVTSRKSRKRKAEDVREISSQQKTKETR